jgi:uncharacterized membrane protein
VTAPASTTTPSGRFHFIDLLRGWAVFVMIETHVVNALLTLTLRQEPFYKALTFVNGLVAPTFLFCAGFGFAISVSRKWDDYTHLRAGAWRYIRRVGFILLVAYTLHLPFFSLRKLLNLTDESLWQGFFQVDILQTIAVTLLLLVGLAAVVRRQHVFVWVVAILALSDIYLAPVVRAMDHSGLPIWFRPYLSLQFKSQFPVFPWSAFLLCGALTGFVFIRGRERGQEARLVRGIALAAAGAAAVSVLVPFLPFSIYPGLDFWNASPQFFFLRLGIVLLCCTLLWRTSERRSPGGASFLTLFGQESLLVYATHLIIVYGHTFEWSFIRLFGKTLGYLECAGLTLALVAGMYLAAWGWHALKAKNARAARAVQYATVAVTFIAFLVREN